MTPPCSRTRRFRRGVVPRLAALLLIGALAGGLLFHAPAHAEDKSDDTIALFDGKTLKGWESTEFGGEGDVAVTDGTIVLPMGSEMTGITTTRKDLPKIDYEIELEAKRVEGHDFFCGLTFPVGESPCTLIVGGWGGSVVGLSNIDHKDASENETTSYQTLENDRWYRVRLRVTGKKIEAWLDKQQVVDFEIKDHKLSIRPEVDLSRPLGFATWDTTAALRNIKLRKLPAISHESKAKP